MGQGLPVIGLIGLSLLVGCGGSKGFAPRPLQAMADAQYRDGDEILAVDRAAYQAVSVNRARSRVNDAGRLNVEVELQSMVNYQAELQARVLFLDADNFQISGDDTGWKMMLVPAGGTSLISETSMSSKATGYTVQLRTPGGGVQ